jgi:hypothetical protein
MSHNPQLSKKTWAVREPPLMSGPLFGCVARCDAVKLPECQTERKCRGRFFAIVMLPVRKPGPVTGSVLKVVEKGEKRQDPAS